MSRVLLPETPAALFAAMAAHPEARLLAGGTDLLVKRRAGAVPPGDLIGLERLAAWRGVREEGGVIRLGALTTHAALLTHPTVRDKLPVLGQALARLGSPAIRSMGSLGGNLVTASPAGDTLPPLIALQAVVEIASAAGMREMLLGDFIHGPGKVALGPGEAVAGVRVVPPAPGAVQHFEKVGLRQALSIAVVSLAAVIGLNPDGRVASARLALGSVGPTVVTCHEAEDVLIGRRLTRTALTRAAALVRRAVNPIDDVRASAAYRRQVAGNLLLRLAQNG